jgi:hypothetical protein
VLVILFGDIGSGKTLLATVIAMNDERPVLANYKIDSKKWVELEPQMLNEVKEATLVIIDEAYSWLESRLSGKDINRYLSYCLFQSRKRGIDFVLTAQLLSTIDLRFKNMADVYILCEQYRGGFVYTIMYPGRRGRRVMTMNLETASKYWGAYDTYELVNPIDDELLFKITPNKADFLPEVDSIIEEMLKEVPGDAWTKGMVSDYCLDKMFPHSYVAVIYNRLKRKLARGVADQSAEQKEWVEEHMVKPVKTDVKKERRSKYYVASEEVKHAKA